MENAYHVINSKNIILLHLAIGSFRFGAKAGIMDVPSACTLVKVNKCESKLVLKSDERTPCKTEPIYPSSTESLDSQQKSGSNKDKNAGNNMTSHSAMFVLSVLCLLLCRWSRFIYWRFVQHHEMFGFVLQCLYIKTIVLFFWK